MSIRVILVLRADLDGRKLNRQGGTFSLDVSEDPHMGSHPLVDASFSVIPSTTQLELLLAMDERFKPSYQFH